MSLNFVRDPRWQCLSEQIHQGHPVVLIWVCCNTLRQWFPKMVLKAVTTLLLLPGWSSHFHLGSQNLMRSKMATPKSQKNLWDSRWWHLGYRWVCCDALRFRTAHFGNPCPRLCHPVAKSDGLCSIVMTLCDLWLAGTTPIWSFSGRSNTEKTHWNREVKWSQECKSDCFHNFEESFQFSPLPLFMPLNMKWRVIQHSPTNLIQFCALVTRHSFPVSFLF